MSATSISANGLSAAHNQDPGAMRDYDIPTAPSLLSRILFRIFDALCCGAILLDSRKFPIHLNDRAGRCMGETFSTTRGFLCAADRVSDALFQTIMDQSLKYGASQTHWRREAIALKRRDSRPLIARVIPVEGEAQGHLDGAALVLLLIDPEDCPVPSFGILKQVFELTKTEARIATQLVCGQTMQNVAEQTGVSVGTIRSQTKAIFAKTQTNRQAELVGLLTRLALISEDDPHGAAATERRDRHSFASDQGYRSFDPTCCTTTKTSTVQAANGGYCDAVRHGRAG